MAPTPTPAPAPMQPPPPAGRMRGGWLTIAFVILIALLIWAVIPKGTGTASPKPYGAVGIYNPNKICPMPAPRAVDGSINNPLGIKFSGDLVQRLGKDSGIAAQDGGTFATFSTPEQGIDAGKQILRSKTGIYAGQTVDWTARKWSNNGYGAEVAASTGINPDAIVSDLPEAQMDALLAAIAKREGIGPAATAVPYVNPNDHSKDKSLGEFTVVLTEGCFGDWVRVPRYWNSWESNELVAANEPVQYVGFWFFGWSRSRGPFLPNNIPGWTAPPDAGDGRAKWRLQGKGALRYVQTS